MHTSQVHIANLTLQDAVDILFYVFPEGEAVIRRQGWQEPQFVLLDGTLRHQRGIGELPTAALPPGETLRTTKDWFVTPVSLGSAEIRIN